jgi:hypothetical protein
MPGGILVIKIKSLSYGTCMEGSPSSQRPLQTKHDIIMPGKDPDGVYV